MDNIYLTKAIQFLKPTAQFVLRDGDYSKIEWHFLDGEAPSQAEIDSAIEQVKADESKAQIDKATAKAALLDRLGITEAEAKLLLS